MSNQSDQNLAEWERVRAQHFPDVTDHLQLLYLHRAYMLGYSAGMTWMRDLFERSLKSPEVKL